MKTKLKEKLLKKRPKNGTYYIIAIDGRGGAGKTTLTAYIAKLLPDFSVLNGDEYFEHDDNTIAFGSFNDERYHKDVIKPLMRSMTSFTYYPYYWNKDPHIQEKKFTIKQGVIIERCFSFNFGPDYDLKIWVDIQPRLALQRGQERDEMPLEQGYRSWKEVWQPAEDEYIKKIRPLEIADIVIDGTKPFEEQLS